MRLLHISDWHVGRTTYGVSRAEDHAAVFAEIVAVARDARPDLILHTGDLFDGARPAIEDMQRGTAALQELATVAPLAVLAGNHDSPALFRLFSSLLGGAYSDQMSRKQPQIRFVDKARGGPAGVLRYPIDTPRGEQMLRIAPLPFVRDGLIVDTMEDPATWLRSYTDRIQAMEAALGLELAADFNPSRDVNIFAAHLYVGGATFHRSEKPLHITDVYATTVDGIPPVSYAAFGHIHKPQPLPGGVVTGRYAGSPIPMDFDERDETKTVVIVDAEPGRPAKVQPVNLSGGRPLKQFTGTLTQLATLAPGWGKALSKLTIHTEAPSPTLSYQVAELLPEAVLCGDVIEVCAGSTLAPIEETTAGTETEPQLPELFREFLTTTVTTGVQADRVADRFAAMLHALGEEHPPSRDEERLFDELARHGQNADRIAAGDLHTGDLGCARQDTARGASGPTKPIAKKLSQPDR
jgi:DNA repair protein SbcD/Mre11